MKDKLLKLQESIGAIKKDSENPFFKSAYFDINKLVEVVKPELSKLKLVLLQPLVIIDGKSAIQSTIKDTESEEQATSTIFLPDNLDPQKMGSAITYYRRYTLQSLLALQAEDDDGNSAKPPKKEVKKVEPKVSKIDQQKIEIGNLLHDNHNPLMTTPEEYKAECLKVTGFELIEANFEDILNTLKK